jgi:hypothetical protein
LDVRAASVIALQNGGIIVPHPTTPDAPQRVEWDIAGFCRDPVPVLQRGAGHMIGDSDLGVAVRPDTWEPGRDLALMVPCRQCEPCLKVRAWRWGQAAVREFELAHRTWFGTITFRPEVRYRLVAATRDRLDRVGVRLELLPPAEQFRELTAEAGHLVTNYLKALRDGRASLKVKPARFRYLMTVEPHADWFPHFHVLLHEVDPLKPLRFAGLEPLWPHGFTKFRLARSSNACHYVAKYLSKFSFARLRASLNYGGEASPQIEDKLSF